MKILVILSIFLVGFTTLRQISVKSGDLIQVKGLKVQCVVTDSLECHHTSKFPRIEWILYKNKLTVVKRDSQVATPLPIFEVEIP